MNLPRSVLRPRGLPATTGALRSSGAYPAAKKKRFLAVHQVAELLEVSERTVRRWCARGVLPAHQVMLRGRWVVAVATLERKHLELLELAAEEAEEGDDEEEPDEIAEEFAAAAGMAPPWAKRQF